jgi:hypothetical protein
MINPKATAPKSRYAYKVLRWVAHPMIGYELQSAQRHGFTWVVGEVRECGPGKRREWTGISKLVKGKRVKVYNASVGIYVYRTLQKAKENAGGGVVVARVVVDPKDWLYSGFTGTATYEKVRLDKVYA